ncbi:MAG: hypothetical protein JKY01_09625, partial [Pseudomonadales bacterium]|nr:hypothetical protein [Pseudomonadales bacterium]
RNCIIKNAIIDSNCNITENTRIGVDRAADEKRFFVSPNGIVLVSKDMLEQEAVNHVA